MDLLGKKGEEATETLEEFDERLGKLESHLNAVDSALQDFVDNYSRILQEQLDYHDDEILKIQEIIEESKSDEERIDRIEKRIRKMDNRLSKQEKELKNVVETDIGSSISDVVESLKQTRSFMKTTRDRIQSLEKHVDELEGELYVEMNNRDFDFEKKLDRREYEKREEKLEQEVKKLRASVHTLADQLDSRDDIEIE